MSFLILYFIVFFMETNEVSTIPSTNPFEVIADRLSRIENILLDIKHPQPSENAPVYYSQKECADMLHVSVVTIIDYRKKGWLTGRRLGSKILFTKEDIEAAVKKIAVERYKRV